MANPLGAIPERHYAVGTALYPDLVPQARLISNAVAWLLDQRNDDGTWGGNDALDRFITTNHAVMALMAVGFSPKSPVLSSAIEYLVNVDKEKVLSFFWRAAPLLNLPDQVEVVVGDMEYLWKYRRRIGAHKDYPVPFFLLKLLRFIHPMPELSFTISDVLGWVIEEWTNEDCWYGRTSISSMALALIYDLDFPDNSKIIERTRGFLEDRFTPVDADSGCFSGHLVDDSFLVFNLCETEFFQSNSGPLWEMVERTMAWIEHQCVDGCCWESSPPFGGDIGYRTYPTAVVVRAMLAFHGKKSPHFLQQISSALLEPRLLEHRSRQLVGFQRIPFWGNVAIPEEDDICFVLMPFSPIKLTEIYERYIKQPIEAQLDIRCIRADDIYRSSEIMRDIWEYLNRAQIIIADLTNKNPNVFYELGMAHVLGKYVILISQNIDDIPFDLRGVRSIIYEDRISGYERLSEQVLRYIRTHRSSR